MYMTQPDRQHVQHIRDYCEEIREIIWETAVNDIPALKQFCDCLLYTSDAADELMRV